MTVALSIALTSITGDPCTCFARAILASQKAEEQQAKKITHEKYLNAKALFWREETFNQRWR
jgi:hypothetical protein